MSARYGVDYADPYADVPHTADLAAVPDLAPVDSHRMVDGAAFILDTPADVPALWGSGDEVLWAAGESLVVVGGPGVGKTTIVGQVARGRLGLASHVLGHPVVPGERRVLYLAMDRPRQIARSLARQFRPDDRAVLAERLRVWQGPPLADVAKHTDTLLGLAQMADADTLIVDSIKDAAIGLSDDEVGAGYNRARQRCIAEGIEVLELHHLVKRGPNGAKPKTLADVYGSTWITSGAGSVLLVWGEAGDPVVELVHLKQPASEVGPLQVAHDHDTGTSTVLSGADPLLLLRAAGDRGLNARQAAGLMFSTESPRPAEVEKARRRLERLTRDDLAVEQPGDRATSTPTTWVAKGVAGTFTETFTHPSERGPFPTPTDPSRQEASPQVGDLHGTLHDLHGPDLHASPPLFRGGEAREGGAA